MGEVQCVPVKLAGIEEASTYLEELESGEELSITFFLFESTYRECLRWNVQSAGDHCRGLIRSLTRNTYYIREM